MFDSKRLSAIRHALSLSVADMAEIAGLSSENAGDQIRAMEREAQPISGPLSRVLDYLAQSVEIDSDPKIANQIMRGLPRFLECSNLEDIVDDSQLKIIMHTRWPRFYGVLVGVLEQSTIQLMEQEGMRVVDLTEAVTLGSMIVIFIDRPSGDQTSIIMEAARLKIQQARRDLRIE